MLCSFNALHSVLPPAVRPVGRQSMMVTAITTWSMLILLIASMLKHTLEYFELDSNGNLF